MSCDPSHWNMLIMLIKLSAQAIFFIGFGQTVQRYFKNWFGMESSNNVEKLSVGQWIQKLNVMLC